MYLFNKFIFLTLAFRQIHRPRKEVFGYVDIDKHTGRVAWLLFRCKSLALHWGSKSKPLYSDSDALQPFKPHEFIKYVESFKSLVNSLVGQKI